MIIAAITATTIINSINPIFDTLCIEKAKGIATEITNAESSNVLQNTHYSDLVQIEKDGNGNINMVKADVVTMNRIASDIALEIQKKLNDETKTTVAIPLGSFTGIKYIAGYGPDVNLKIVPAGNIITDFKSEFIAQGINQTMHRIYLELTCEVNVVTPYKTIKSEIVNQVLLVESVIVGNIPSSYYNLEGMDKKDSIDLMKEQ